MAIHRSTGTWLQCSLAPVIAMFKRQAIGPPVPRIRVGGTVVASAWRPFVAFLGGDPLCSFRWCSIPGNTKDPASRSLQCGVIPSPGRSGQPNAHSSISAHPEPRFSHVTVESVAVNRLRGGVLCARCAMAAVVTSRPQLSSMVTPIRPRRIGRGQAETCRFSDFGD